MPNLAGGIGGMPNLAGSVGGMLNQAGGVGGMPNLAGSGGGEGCGLVIDGGEEVSQEVLSGGQVDGGEEVGQQVLNGGDIMAMLKRMDQNLLHNFRILDQRIEELSNKVDILGKRVEGDDSSCKLVLQTSHEGFLQYDAMLEASEEEYDLLVCQLTLYILMQFLTICFFIMDLPCS